MNAQTILVVDDDTALRELVGRFLEQQGYAVLEAADVPAMKSVLLRHKPDLIVLDVMMPGEDGLSALRSFSSAERRPPVIMLSALGGEVDRIVGLELGADDYLPKPCNPRELLARVRAVLRRAGEKGAPEKFTFGRWAIDLASCELTAPSGVKVNLSRREWSILTELVRANRRVLSREELIARTSGDGADASDAFDRSIDIAVSRLRRKLAEHDGSELVRTVRGEGYGLAPEVVRAPA
jgi:two-component system OmpR family response regulator